LVDKSNRAEKQNVAFLKKLLIAFTRNGMQRVITNIFPGYNGAQKSYVV